MAARAYAKQKGWTPTVCNRHLSLKWQPEAAGFTATAAEVLAGAKTGIDATIGDLRDITFARQMVAASKAASLMRRAENRAERRARSLKVARRAAKIVGAYHDLRGLDVYARFDEARWLLVKLNRLIEEAVLTRDLRIAYRDNRESDEAIADLAGHYDHPVAGPGAIGLPAIDRQMTHQGRTQYVPAIYRTETA